MLAFLKKIETNLLSASEGGMMGIFLPLTMVFRMCQYVLTSLDGLINLVESWAGHSPLMISCNLPR